MASIHRYPIIVVEGTDDEQVIRHLLSRHGMKWRKDDTSPPDHPGIEKPGGREALLKSVKAYIRFNAGIPVGFVLDANASPEQSWAQISNLLNQSGVETPAGIPATGFIGLSSRFGTPVGVWLMPDNENAGALEGFLETLIPPGDELFSYAGRCTEDAGNYGARIPARRTRKAILHAWLAWQEAPGRPYGTAIRAGYFGAHGPVADRFADWLQRLVGQQAANGPPVDSPEK